MGSLKDSLLIIRHSGGINGFNTSISRLPQNRQLIVLLNNTGRAPLNGIRNNILQILYDQPVVAPKKPVTDLLRQAIATEPVAAVQQKFAGWRANKAYDLNEDEINALGYELLERKKISEAITVFTLNAEAFPASFNVYDSRGEAYLAAGDKEKAIRDYQKSVELNPRNTGGITKLAELGKPFAAPATVSVDSTVLAGYVGDYQLAPAFTITITQAGNRLLAQATGQAQLELFPESATKFYYKVVDAQVSFTKNEKGETGGLILHQNGQNVPGKRVSGTR